MAYDKIHTEKERSHPENKGDLGKINAVRRPASSASLKELATMGSCDPMFPCGEGCSHYTAALQLNGHLPIYEEINGQEVECYATAEGRVLAGVSNK